MFGKKKQMVSAVEKSPAGVGAASAEMKVKPKKVKPLSPSDIMASGIEQLSGEEALKYKLPEVYGGELVVVNVNPQYPRKGRKYMVGMEKMVGDKPCGKISHLWDSNKPMEVARWIVERDGKPFN